MSFNVEIFKIENIGEALSGSDVESDSSEFSPRLFSLHRRRRGFMRHPRFRIGRRSSFRSLFHFELPALKSRRREKRLQTKTFSDKTQTSE